MTTTLWVTLYLLGGVLFAEFVLDLKLLKSGKLRAVTYFWTVAIYPIILAISLISIFMGEGDEDDRIP